jgi:DNA ligase 1
MVQSFFANSQGISSFIVDAEIVAIDASNDSLKSFQELSNRARKDVKLHEIKVDVCIYAFDLMYLNGQVSALMSIQLIFTSNTNLVIIGKSLLQESFRSRRKLLRTHFPAVQADRVGSAKFDHVESCESEEGRKAIEQFWQRAVDSRCEGLMIKVSGRVSGPIPPLFSPDSLEHLSIASRPRRSSGSHGAEEGHLPETAIARNI